MVLCNVAKPIEDAQRLLVISYCTKLAVSVVKTIQSSILCKSVLKPFIKVGNMQLFVFCWYVRKELKQMPLKKRPKRIITVEFA